MRRFSHCLRKDASHRRVNDRDTLGVAARLESERMTIQLICPWCQDEVAFTVHDADDEIVCEACGVRSQFAPDSTITFDLLYAPAA